MVKDTDSLDLIFRALADPTRREIMERLSRSRQPMTVGELARPYNMSLPAVSKHLKYLRASGLITLLKRGRNHLFAATQAPIEEANWWLAEQLHFWED